MFIKLGKMNKEKQNNGILKTFLKVCVTLAIVLSSVVPQSLASSDIQKNSLVRDAEMEDVLRMFIKPIFKVAGLNPDELNVHILVNPDINAFATLNNSIFVHTGLFTKSKNVGQVIGVFAHETGHIAGRHVFRQANAIQKANNTSLLAIALGTIVGIASGHPELGIGVAGGAMQLAAGSFFTYSRTEENAADRAAERFLDALGWSSKGLLEIMQMFADQDLMSSHHHDPFMRTLFLVIVYGPLRHMWKSHLTPTFSRRKSL